HTCLRVTIILPDVAETTYDRSLFFMRWFPKSLTSNRLAADYGMEGVLLLLGEALKNVMGGGVIPGFGP
ncbi:hypothetical protein LCGC14_2975470, partial [marine sediment metagenome]